MKSLMLLWKTIAEDLAIGCRTSTHRDCKTVSVRVEHEGVSFLTITLPTFGKGFERALETGCLDRQDFQAFAFKSGLPKFLSGFLCQVFDTTSGRLLDEPNIAAIQAVRQLTLVFGKVFALPTKERERAAMRAFIECEQEVRESVRRLERDVALPSRRDFSRVGNILFGRLYRDIDLSLRTGDIFGSDRSSEQDVDGDVRRSNSLQPSSPHLPVHGPGATADGLKGNRKWMHETWTTRLDRVFPMGDYLIPNYSFWEQLQDVNLLEPEAEMPVKVISVPKTQKTPRIIAMEPTVMMFMQKALQKQFYEKVERDYLLNTFIGFTDQTPNQDLACKGSLNGELATLDLSEASDRVSCLHVEDLFLFNPLLLEAVMSVRSTKADVDGHGVIPLTKYASMGSALTFPMEAMVFLTIVFLGIEDKLNRPLTRRDLYDYVGKVRVFGDDIIVPVDCVDSVIERLEAFGLRVNRNKSFWTGKFRESCGKEYYDGEDVSVVRVRRFAPSSRKDAQEINSWVDLSNQLYRAGLWRSVRWLDSYISGILKDFPVVAETSPVLGRFSFMGYETQRMSTTTFSPLVKGWRLRSVIPRNTLDDHFALLKWFTLRGELPLADEDHLERSGRPLVVDIKRGWFQPF